MSQKTLTDRLQELCRQFQTRFPEAGVTFGYIGNCDLSGRNQFDDRSWKFFAKNPENPGGYSVSYPVYLTEEREEDPGPYMKHLEFFVARWLRETLGYEDLSPPGPVERLVDRLLPVHNPMLVPTPRRRWQALRCRLLGHVQPEPYYELPTVHCRRCGEKLYEEAREVKWRRPWGEYK